MKLRQLKLKPVKVTCLPITAEFFRILFSKHRNRRSNFNYDINFLKRSNTTRNRSNFGFYCNQMQYFEAPVSEVFSLNVRQLNYNCF